MATAIRTPFFTPTTTTTTISSHNQPLLRLHFPHSSKLRNFSISCSSHSQPESEPLRKRPPYIPNHIPDSSYVRIFDTTLRDGEQSPGASMTSKEKLDIARQLAKLGVDIIEAGFPAASKDDFEAVKIIATEVGNAVDENGYVPVICGPLDVTRKTFELLGRLLNMQRDQEFILSLPLAPFIWSINSECPENRLSKKHAAWSHSPVV